SKTTFHKKDIKPYLDFLTTVQNAMTLYGVESKVATIKATPTVAKYFEKDMKKFLPSQKFKKKLADGSVLFTLNYTQELEILPFVQKWLPDLLVLEPVELREAYTQKLKLALENYDAIPSN
ncbi:WYL domain-containing protein, partial [Sulfurovum sp. bin170]|uniref:WYL domain-containing protein n=1 Tax=Sulfurovum sp. bin170 TaxID=2695268 RepID=UPI0013E0BFE4